MCLQGISALAGSHGSVALVMDWASCSLLCQSASQGRLHVCVSLCRQNLQNEGVQPSCTTVPQQTERCPQERCCAGFQLQCGSAINTPALWICTVKDEVSSYVWDRSSQNVNLLALRKCAEDTGVGVIKIMCDCCAVLA